MLASPLQDGTSRQRASSEAKQAACAPQVGEEKRAQQVCTNFTHTHAQHFSYSLHLMTQVQQSAYALHSGPTHAAQIVAGHGHCHPQVGHFAFHLAPQGPRGGHLQSPHHSQKVL